MSNQVKLVVKDVSEAGGYGVVFGRDMTKQQLAEWKTLITEQSGRFIAQEVIDFIDLPVIDEDGSEVMRKTDLRADGLKTIDFAVTINLI